MTEWLPVRPYREWPRVETERFDPRQAVFIPARSIDADQVRSVNPRTMRLIGAKAYHNSTQAIGTGSTTLKTLNSVVFDTADMFDNANDRLVIPFYGIWAVSVYCEFATSAAGTRRGVFVYLNGADNINQNITPQTATPTQVMVSTPLVLEKGDTVAMRVHQDSGGNLDTNTGVSNNFVSAIYLGVV